METKEGKEDADEERGTKRTSLGTESEWADAETALEVQLSFSFSSGDDASDGEIVCKRREEEEEDLREDGKKKKEEKEPEEEEGMTGGEDEEESMVAAVERRSVDGCANFPSGCKEEEEV